jgi:HTH-type transcriptional regulator, transcriptional repressor of NAD biosynthesis genes
MQTYRHGFVLGAFYPPTLGDHALIRHAAGRATRVTVVILGAAWENISLADRVAWLRTEHAADTPVTVVGIRCDIPLDFAGEAAEAAHWASIQAALAGVTDDPIDAVFGSEPLGEEVAARISAEYIPFDTVRSNLGVPSSTIRADLPAHWRLLSGTVRAGLAVRVVVLGAESTGSTTIARLLAEEYRRRGSVWEDTKWVPEYARDYALLKWEHAKTAAQAAGQTPPPLNEIVWETPDFDVVATEQTAQENAAAAAGSPLLVCDTDALATAVWERRYFGARARTGQGWAGTRLPRHDLYLLTDHIGVPWEDDGMREGDLDVRAAMTGWFVDTLTAGGHSWVLLTGSIEQRLALAVRCTEAVLATRLVLP